MVRTVTDKETTSKITTANRIAWDEAAPIHAAHNQKNLLLAFSAPGFSCLDPIETDILKSLGVAGKDVAQVCCNNGCEILSVKNMGAGRCVGFDGSQAFIGQARELAAAARLDVSFVCTDVYEIDQRYRGQFDLVTITIGVISWMPDLAGFFDAVASLLKPEGGLFIYEQHPIVDMIEPAPANAPINWEMSYFSKEPYVETSGLDYWSGNSYDAKPTTSFLHTLAEVVMAGVNCGLQVEDFAEHPHHISHSNWNVEASDIGLPMCYTLVLRAAK